MRKIEFKTNVNGMTKIFVEGKELATAFDQSAFRTFRSLRKSLPPVTGQNMIDAIAKKLSNDHMTLAKDETAFILKYIREEIGV